MRRLTLLAALALGLVSALFLGTPRASAAPVQYVRVCSAYPGYFNFPGTDICVNPMTGQTLRFTEQGLFFSLTTTTQGTWAKSARAACRGRVQSIGTFRPGNLRLNSVLGAYETQAKPFSLSGKEFISGLLISGSFEAPAKGFCVAMRDSTGKTAVLGCQDLSLLANTPALWRMVPHVSVPPTGFTAPFSFVGGNFDQPWNGPATTGAVTLSACIEKAR